MSRFVINRSFEDALEGGLQPARRFSAYAGEAKASRGPKPALQSVFVSFVGRKAMRHSVEKPLPAVAALI